MGQGAYGEVRECTHKISGIKRAVKILRKVRMDDKEKANMINEIENLENLDHPNILKLHESYECEKRYYIVTDICKGGELFDEITKNKHFTESNAGQIMYALLKCLNYIHSEGLMHRDLKPENLLLEEHKAYD